MAKFAPRSIQAVAAELGLSDEEIELYGRGKAKIELSAIERPEASRGKGRLILVTAINFRDKVGESEIDSRLVTWGRALDMNDRFLRNVVLGLGGKSHGTPRQDRFDITAASEIMAIMALATGYEDLEARLSRIVV